MLALMLTGKLQNARGSERVKRRQAAALQDGEIQSQRKSAPNRSLSSLNARTLTRVRAQPRDAFELLIATILSAQCTDERVTKVTADLFRKYRKPETIKGSGDGNCRKTFARLASFVTRRNHPGRVRACLSEDSTAKVPQTMEELLRLPGVARKTANVVLGVAYGKSRRHRRGLHM